MYLPVHGVRAKALCGCLLSSTEMAEKHTVELHHFLLLIDASKGSILKWFNLFCQIDTLEGLAPILTFS